MSRKFIGCTIKTLPDAAFAPFGSPAHIAVMRDKYWGEKGVTLTVSFPFDNPSKELRAKILSHMNAWGGAKGGNVQFVETSGTGQVRIARTARQGYWSFLGRDILGIAANQPTMNLDSFTMQTPDKEFYRVVRHETGHTLGFPHEHMRADLVARLDRAKTIDYFARTQGWSERDVMQQVLTPLSEASLMATPADQTSIMCYMLPGSITKDGKPIPGGPDINESDLAFAAKIYPLPSAPPPIVVPPTTNGEPATMIILDASGRETARFKLTRIAP